MQPHLADGRSRGRIGAAVLLAFAIIFGFGGATIEYAFSSDPLGPRTFPVALAIVLGLLAILYWFQPGQSENWPRGRALAGVLGIPVLVAACAIMLEPLGFPIAIFVLTAGVGAIFGAPWKAALIGGVIHAIVWLWLFRYVLEVRLPLGDLFGF